MDDTDVAGIFGFFINFFCKELIHLIKAVILLFDIEIAPKHVLIISDFVKSLLNLFICEAWKLCNY